MSTWIAKPVTWLIGAAVVALLAWWLIASLTGGSSAKVEARLGRNTTEAAVASGQDAVASVGAQGAAEQAADTITAENDDAIRNAQGADAPVAAPARDAGLASLCRRAAYSERPECLQHAAAGGMGRGSGGGTAAPR